MGRDAANIVLVVADTLSAFNLPMYGYDRDTAPFLERLSDENVFFQFAYANAPWTLPSHASLFSGELPAEHNATRRTLQFTGHSFVDDLNEEGYDTYGFSNNPPLAVSGFRDSFDEFIGGECIKLKHRGLDAFHTALEREQTGEYSGKREKYLGLVKEAARQRDIASLVEAARYLYREKVRDGDHRFVADSGADATNTLIEDTLSGSDEPFFLFVNYMEPHEPYHPPQEVAGRWLDDAAAVQAEYDDRANLGAPENIGIDVGDELRDGIRRLYDAEIRYLDSKIQELYDTVTEISGDTVFIILSDHGENLGHQGMWGHQYGIWERLIRVPLIIAGPSIDAATIDRTVSLRELYKFINGDADIEDLGSGTVQASYSGHVSTDADLSGHDDYGRRVRRNAAQAVVEGTSGAIAHTHLDDIVFKPRADGPGEPRPAADHDLLKRARQKHETRGIDI